jgi:hypothetical protein
MTAQGDLDTKGQTAMGQASFLARESPPQVPHVLSELDLQG